MRESEVNAYKREFEDMPKSFFSFGADLIDAGSPNPAAVPCGAQVMAGRWQEAYEMWLRDGEYSRIWKNSMWAHSRQRENHQ